MKVILCTTMIMVWLTMTGNSVLAKNPVEWNPGELTLLNGTELKGELGYNWKAEVIEYREGNIIKAYSAFQVRAFKYFDTHQNVLRKFVVKEHIVKHGLVRPLFLEEVIVGSITVYREVRSIPAPIKVGALASYNTYEGLGEDIDNFTYLISTGDELVNLAQFHRTVWPTLKLNFEQELTQYEARFPVGTNTTTGRLMLINRYNYLAHQQSLADQEFVSTGQ